MKTKTVMFYLLAFALVTSCSIQKRRYLDGYSVQWISHKHNSKPEAIVQEKPGNNFTGPQQVKEILTLEPVFSEKQTSDELITVPMSKPNPGSNKKVQRMNIRPVKQISTDHQKYQPFVMGDVKEGNEKRNWAAILGFILAFFFPILGLIFSCIGLKSKLRGLAMAGLIISIVFCALLLILLAAA
jgi:hypothetical protein